MKNKEEPTNNEKIKAEEKHSPLTRDHLFINRPVAGAVLQTASSIKRFILFLQIFIIS